MLEERRFATLAELTAAERISRSYVCRVPRLALLEPEIVEAILDGRQPKGLRLVEMLGNGPRCWKEQRLNWLFD